MIEYVVKFTCNRYDGKTIKSHVVLTQQQYHQLLHMGTYIKTGIIFQMNNYTQFKTTDIFLDTRFPEYDYYKQLVNKKRYADQLIGAIDFAIFNEM